MAGVNRAPNTAPARKQKQTAVKKRTRRPASKSEGPNTSVTNDSLNVLRFPVVIMVLRFWPSIRANVEFCSAAAKEMPISSQESGKLIGRAPATIRKTISMVSDVIRGQRTIRRSGGRSMTFAQHVPTMNAKISGIRALARLHWPIASKVPIITTFPVMELAKTRPFPTNVNASR